MSMKWQLSHLTKRELRDCGARWELPTAGRGLLSSVFVKERYRDCMGSHSSHILSRQKKYKSVEFVYHFTPPLTD